MENKMNELKDSHNGDEQERKEFEAIHKKPQGSPAHGLRQHLDTSSPSLSYDTSSKPRDFEPAKSTKSKRWPSERLKRTKYSDDEAAKSKQLENSLVRAGLVPASTRASRTPAEHMDPNYRVVGIDFAYPLDSPLRNTSPLDSRSPLRPPPMGFFDVDRSIAGESSVDGDKGGGRLRKIFKREKRKKKEGGKDAEDSSSKKPTA